MSNAPGIILSHLIRNSSCVIEVNIGGVVMSKKLDQNTSYMEKQVYLDEQVAKVKAAKLMKIDHHLHIITPSKCSGRVYEKAEQYLLHEQKENNIKPTI